MARDYAAEYAARRGRSSAVRTAGAGAGVKSNEARYFSSGLRAAGKAGGGNVTAYSPAARKWVTLAPSTMDRLPAAPTVSGARRGKQSAGKAPAVFGGRGGAWSRTQLSRLQALIAAFGMGILDLLADIEAGDTH